MNRFRQCLHPHRTRPEDAGLGMLVEVVAAEAVLELLSAVDLDVPILGLLPSCWR